MDAMHPSRSSYRVDLLTRAYPEAKAQLATLSATAGGQQEPTVDTEPWFNMEAAWLPVGGPGWAVGCQAWLLPLLPLVLQRCPCCCKVQNT
jgi:hypothetical protein